MMLKWIKSHLVEDIADFKSWYSVRVNGVGIAVALAWPQLPDELKSAIPGGLATALALFCLFALVSRAVKQGPKE